MVRDNAQDSGGKAGSGSLGLRLETEADICDPGDMDLAGLEKTSRHHPFGRPNARAWFS